MGPVLLYLFNSLITKSSFIEIIQDLDKKLIDFFPEYSQIPRDSLKKEITLKHLLTMTGGMHWDESSYPYTDPRNMHNQLNNSPDQIKFALELKMIEKPGWVFLYNSGIAMMLGGIVKNV